MFRKKIELYLFSKPHPLPPSESLRINKKDVFRFPRIQLFIIWSTEKGK